MIKFLKKKSNEPKDFKEVLAYFKNLEKDIERLTTEFEIFKKESTFSIQKVGIVRFNPFSEIGGNQSFSLALLDGNNDGVVITSLYTREGNRVYSKPIKQGKSKYLLSTEEKEAIEKAKTSKNLDSR